MTQTQVNHSKHSTIGMTLLEAFRGSFPSGHLGKKTFVSDAIAQAKLVRTKVLEHMDKNRKKMQERLVKILSINVS